MDKALKRIRNILNIVIWTVVGLYLTTVVLLHIPAIQDACGRQAARLLSEKLGTEVKVQRIDLGFLNRVIIDGLYVADRKGKPMLQASRVSVKLDFIALARRDISISSAQLFGLRANLYRENEQTKPNFQFVLDSLASKNTEGPSTTIRITSVVIRRGAIDYHRQDKPRSAAFSAHHMSLTDISAHLIFNQLTTDSVNIKLKNISFKERAGLHVKSLTAKLTANATKATLEDFRLELPGSALTLTHTSARYRLKDGKLFMPSIVYRGSITDSHITPADLAFALPQLKQYNTAVGMWADVSGTHADIHIKDMALKAKEGLDAMAHVHLSNLTKSMGWDIDLQKLKMQKAAIKKYLSDVHPQLAEPQEIVLTGRFSGSGQDINAQGRLQTDLGNIDFDAQRKAASYKGFVETTDLDLARLLHNKDLGNVSAKIQLKDFRQYPRHASFNIEAAIAKAEYRGYTYNHVALNGQGTLNAANQLNSFEGTASLNDPNGNLSLSGKVGRDKAQYTAQVEIEANHVNLSALNITQQWPGRMVSLQANAQLAGTTLNNATGQVNLQNINIRDKEQQYALENLELKAGYDAQNEHFVSLNSDFGNALVVGTFDYSAIVQNIENAIVDKLPSIQHLTPVTKRSTPKTNARLYAEMTKADWAEFFFNIPIALQQPVQLSGTINSETNLLNINLQAPDFTYNGKRYRDSYLQLLTPNDTLRLNIMANSIDEQNKRWTWNVQSAAADNHLLTTLAFDNHAAHPFKGTLNTETQFFKKENGEAAAHVNIHPSEIVVEDSIWTIEPADIIYSKKHLTVDHFAIHHDDQHIIVSGLATPHAQDVLVADFKDVDVSYILNLINFDAVQFDGRLSGQAHAAGIFGKPQAHANLLVSRFEFETGNMGVLDAAVTWNEQLKQIDIQAVANDRQRQTVIQGYVSPQKNYIDLDIEAKNTRLQFLEGFCSSFMQNVDAGARGNVRLYGDLGELNLTGQLVADGTIGITPLNTTYTLTRDTVTLKTNEIVFRNDTIYDRNGNTGILNGTLRHDHLSDLQYNLNIAVENLLAYDTHTFGTNTFYGTAYATGNCNITGRSGEVTIDIDATPQKGSLFVYNVAGQGTPDIQDFIRWTTRNDSTANDSIAYPPIVLPTEENLPEMPSDIRLNFLINCTPDATLKLIMDSQTGDYITLNGNGVLRANYYNKGSFDMFGNYVVDRGTYSLTIQNIIKKEFQFRPGSTIAFGGDPYNAALNLQAAYTVNGVSLADLNIGRSFSSNNIRVNCLMNITGTPNTPHVEFNLDMPTVNADAKRMIYSLINSEEEMNQQVLYLLAVGRFYAQRSNNAATDNPAQQSQASLAMQSILSGTLSQQINTVLSSVINNANWNFGANISTGTEGFNNAEYEGLLSGRLLNNRLLINGQFGYRDNPNATTSFIGDFDIRYLLYPNGNLAVKVYNQTNDRYFTRNTLTTQGIGLILKKDFTNLKDLFGRREKKP